MYVCICVLSIFYVCKQVRLLYTPLSTAGESTSHTDSEKAVSGLEDGEDNEDTEYNYLADHQEEEKEEFRNDRAVKISSKRYTLNML